MPENENLVIPEEPVNLPTPEELVLKYEQELIKTHEYYNKKLDELGRENSMLSDTTRNYIRLAETYYKNVNELIDGLRIIHKLTEMLLNRNIKEPKEEE